jgi:hypothetical protein
MKSITKQSKKNASKALKVALAKTPAGSLTNLHQADGKLDLEPAAEPINAEKKKFTSLAQFWGEDGLSKYGAKTAEDYNTKLLAMSTADLWNHATALSEVPSDNRDRLTKRLLNRFQAEFNMLHRPTDHIGESNKKVVPENIKKILAEGR